MIEPIGIQEFLNRFSDFTCFDLRPVADYQKHRIPGAVHVTAMISLLEPIDFLFYDIGSFQSDEHFDVPPEIGQFYLEKGYSSFRRWVNNYLKQTFDFRLIAGKTGTGKTELLQQLAALGSPILDLEAIANHRGSAFGKLGMGKQPSQKQFENQLAVELWKCRGRGPIWIEKEGDNIGLLRIPKLLKQGMDQAEGIYLDLPKNERIRFLDEHYGKYPETHLAEAIKKIQTQLGEKNTEKALAFLAEDRFDQSIEILLDYYDQVYTFQLADQKQLETISIQKIQDLKALAKRLVKS